MMDNRFDGGIGMDTSGEEGAVLGTITVYAMGLIFAVVGLLYGGYYTWTHAPVVGGEWWPYIRVAATVFGAFLSMKISAIIGYVLGIPVAVVIAAVYGFIKG